MKNIKPNFADEFEKDAMSALAAATWEGPIAMINFRKYREQAYYPEGNHPSCSGREAYAKFFEVVTPVLEDTDGQIVFASHYQSDVIASGSGEWDEIIVIQYPSRESFLDAMLRVTKSGHEEAMLHRFAGLEKFALIATRPAD